MEVSADAVRNRIVDHLLDADAEIAFTSNATERTVEMPDPDLDARGEDQICAWQDRAREELTPSAPEAKSPA